MRQQEKKSQLATDKMMGAAIRRRYSCGVPSDKGTKKEIDDVEN
jgi:hypothetical protein